MMIAVAALALILGVSLEAIRLKRRRDEFLKRAVTHAQLERVFRDSGAALRKVAALEESVPELLGNHSASQGIGYTKTSLLGISSRTRTLIRESQRKPAELAERKPVELAELRQKAVARHRSLTARFAESAAYDTALKQKYLQAAARPWQSVEPDPPPPESEFQGLYWSERGDYHRALAAYEEALRDDPENYGALNELAWFLATGPETNLRDGKRAIELAARACEISLRQTGDLDPACLDTLAAAYAETGDYEAAVTLQRDAIGMLSPGDPNAKAYRDRLAGYIANEPYREMVH
jgi:tetratricopeptide (TPR) repeat protein